MTSQEELIRACRELGISSRAMKPNETREFIDAVIGRFSPSKTTGHLSIGKGAVAIPLEHNEFTYSDYLERVPTVVFFDQKTDERNLAVEVSDGSALGKIMSKSYGMEYFVADRAMTYLLAVNWYAIEGVGAAVEWMARLENI